jgi:P4 family phage/plasmid primase-like protien
MAKKDLPIDIDWSAYPQDFVDIRYKVLEGKVEYHVEVRGPDGGILYTITSDQFRDKSSLTRAIAREMTKDVHFGFGRDQLPYRWMENRWVNVEKWLLALNDSLHQLIQIGKHHTPTSNSLFSEALSTWQAKSVYDREGLNLRAFGDCPGIPCSDGVLLLDAGTLTVVSSDPKHLNTHVLPLTKDEAFAGWVEVTPPGSENSLLMRFLGSALDKDQCLAFQNWLGYHLLSNKLPNAEKMFYLYGGGGNGKSQLINLIRGLLTNEACAELRLVDLKTSSNIELLQGKLAMLGSEASSKTEVEVLKALVSREPMTCNPKYRDPFRIQPECLITQASNFAPRFDDHSDAMVRRTVALHLRDSFSKSDKKVEDISKEILDKEYPLLVGFALAGAYEISKAGRFVVPPSIEKASEEETSKGNQFASFGGLLEFGPFETEERELYEAYRRWCIQEGRRALSAQSFKDGLIGFAAKHKKRLDVPVRFTSYMPTQWEYPKTGEMSYVVAALKGKTSRPNGYRGVRFAAGHFDTAVGQDIKTDSSLWSKFPKTIEEAHESAIPNRAS